MPPRRRPGTDRRLGVAEDLRGIHPSRHASPEANLGNRFARNPGGADGASAKNQLRGCMLLQPGAQLIGSSRRKTARALLPLDPRAAVHSQRIDPRRADRRWQQGGSFGDRLSDLPAGGHPRSHHATRAGLGACPSGIDPGRADARAQRPPPTGADRGIWAGRSCHPHCGPVRPIEHLTAATELKPDASSRRCSTNGPGMHSWRAHAEADVARQRSGSA
jgi:hypothetical protein